MQETTVRVLKRTRDKIRAQAQAHGESADAYLSRLVEEDIWREKMQTVKRAMQEPAPEYLAESQQWDRVSDTDVVDE